MPFKIFHLFIIFLFVLTGKSQSQFPQNLFDSPVEIPISLSGSFAELRSNHFHSGIDIKTGGEEGLRINACADGYVSRIRISPFGFGKALYVVHPQGYTTVYAHLQKFNSEIDRWAKSEQYKLQKFDVDLFPKPGELKVTKGQLIAFSGNSGSSQGPHLHFEIRDSKTEEPIDPLLFGFSVKDFVRPTLNGIRIYPANNSSLINNKNEPYEPEIAGWGPDYRIKKKDTISVSGSIYFGVNAHDLMPGSSNKNGINLIEIFIDSALFFKWEAQKFNFNETRYINSFIDYAHYQKNGTRFITTIKAPNNQLSMYKKVVNNGIINTEAGLLNKIKINIADSRNNVSSISFIIKGIEEKAATFPETVKPQIFTWNNLNNYRNKDLSISIPANTLYDDIAFEYSSEKKESFTCARIHSIHKTDVPVHSNFDLSIRIDSTCNINTDKLFIARLNLKNKPTYIGGKSDGRFISTKVREFGRYTIMADTTQPVVKAVNISEGKNISSQKNISITISDDLSGIKSYDGYLNEKWILMDYDAKNNLLLYEFDDRLNKGINHFRIKVVDNCGNETEYKCKIVN